MQDLIHTTNVSWLRGRIFALVVLSALLLLSACGPAEDQLAEESMDGSGAELTAVPLPAEENLGSSSAESGYPPPPPAELPVEESYPAETLPPPKDTPIPDVYPPPVEEVFAEPRIRLDLPVRVSDSVVTGTAPPGLALAVVDVTYNGTLLGKGHADSEGRFNITVQGLLEGDRIGLTFDELEPGLSLADMSIKYFPHRGEGFMNLPNVGVMLDTTLVEP